MTSSDQITARVRAIVSEVLGYDTIAPDDDFFRLGGQSLTAVRVVAKIAAELGVVLPVPAVFTAPTPRELARLVATAPAASADAPSGGAAGAASAPLSWQQESMYRFEQVVAGTSTFGSFARMELVGDLDLTAFTAAFLALVRRHDIFRTRYRPGRGGVRQHVVSDVEYELVEHDLTGLPENTRRPELERLVRAFTRRGFDLAGEPGLRLLLGHLAEDRVAVVAAVHHINFDGWSRDVLLDDFAALYRAARTGEPLRLPPLPIRYADFASWQRARFDGPEVDRHLQFWKRTVGDGVPRPPEAEQSTGTFTSMHQSVTIKPGEVERFTRVGAAAGATMFISCLAAFGVVLGDWLGISRLPIATTAANRTGTTTTGVIGLFSTVVPIAVDLSGDPPFRELLARCRASGVEALEHQEYPFEHACLTLDDAGGLLAGLRFGLALHPPIRADRPLGGGLRLVQQRVNLLEDSEQEMDPSTFDLTLELRESAEGVVGHLAHQLDAVPPATASWLTHRFAHVVRRAGDDPTAPLSLLLDESV